MKHGLCILFVVMLAGSLSAQYLAHRRNAFRTPAFSPSDVAGMIAWYAADDISSSDGTEVTAWDDLSGNGNNLTGVSGSVPTWETGEVNGLPALLFSRPSADRLTNTVTDAEFSGEDIPSTTIAVVKSDQGSAFEHTLWAAVSSTDADTKYSIHTYNALTRVTRVEDAGTASTDTGAATISTSNFQVYSVVAAATTVSTYINGVVDLNAASSDVGVITPDIFSVGAVTGASGTGSGWNGFIAEIIIYDSALGTSDRENVEQYLADKYGITL